MTTYNINSIHLYCFSLHFLAALPFGLVITFAIVQTCRTLVTQSFNISQFNLLSARHANECTCHDVQRIAFKASYATTPHDRSYGAIPPYRAPINSPAAAPARRCVRSRSVAFQGTLSWSRSIRRAFLSPRATSHNSVHRYLRDSSRVLIEAPRRRENGDALETIRTRVLVLSRDLGQPG